MQFSPEDPLQARILEALAARSSSRGGTPNGGASPFPCTPNGTATPNGGARSNPAALNRAASAKRGGRALDLRVGLALDHLRKALDVRSVEPPVDGGDGRRMRAFSSIREGAPAPAVTSARNPSERWRAASRCVLKRTETGAWAIAPRGSERKSTAAHCAFAADVGAPSPIPGRRSGTR